MSKKYAVFYSVFFGAVMLLTAILFLVLPKKSFSELEKRSLRTFPQLSHQTLSDGTFCQSADLYLCDHFPARDTFVGINAYSNLLLLRHSQSGVYLAKDGYLISAPADRTKTDYTQVNLTKIREFTQQNGLDTDMMLVPSTGYILEDQLLFPHKQYPDEDVFAAVKDAGIGDFIDLTVSFTSEAERPIYYKTDHHWTTYGAYLAYTQYIQQQGMQPLSPATFGIEEYPGFFGTTYAKAALWGMGGDVIELWKNPQQHVQVSIYDSEQANVYDDFYFYDQLNGSDKYSVFFDENHGKVIVENDSVESGTLLVLKDSFANALVPFLSNHYHRIVMVDMRYYGFSAVSDVVKEYDIQKMLVVYGVDTFVTDKNLLKLK